MPSGAFTNQYHLSGGVGLEFATPVPTVQPSPCADSWPQKMLSLKRGGRLERRLSGEESRRDEPKTTSFLAPIQESVNWVRPQCRKKGGGGEE